MALGVARKKAPTTALPFQAGELANRLHTARALWDRMVDNAKNYDFDPSLQRASDALTGKTIVTEACVATVEKITAIASRAFFITAPPVPRPCTSRPRPSSLVAGSTSSHPAQVVRPSREGRRHA